MRLFIFQRPVRTREEDPEIRDRIIMPGTIKITQTPPVGWTPDGWECVDVFHEREYGRPIIVRVWEQPSV